VIDAILQWTAALAPLLIAGAAVLWAGLLAFAEEASLTDTLHALGDIPVPGGPRRAEEHRALHLARLVLLVVGSVAAMGAVDPGGRGWLSGLLLLAVVALLVFVLGDALPRATARLAPELAEAALPLARRTLRPIAPLVWLLDAADRRLGGRSVPVPGARPELAAAQRDMLLGVFTLADTTVDEVMTSRLDMAAVDLQTSLDDVLEVVRAREHTRLPVYDGTPDNIMGVLFVKDLVPLAMGTAEPGLKWTDLVRPAAFVPETKTLDRQLRDFQRGPAHLAVVVDEFGGTAGLVTLEDILEEIVGEIRDERDAAAEPAIRRDGERFLVDGRVTLDDLSEALGHPFTHPDVSTVGGLVYSVLGRVPRPGDELALDGYRVVVERVERRRVGRVVFERQ
jgi:CBS domain containing-hemolysin-like protein